MPKYQIDFTTTLIIDADTEEKALEQAWNDISHDEPQAWFTAQAEDITWACEQGKEN